MFLFNKACQTRHSNYYNVKRMMNLDIMLKAPVDLDEKYLIYNKFKPPRKPFKFVVRNLSLLELIQSEGYYLIGISSKDNNKYFITFVNDKSIVYYVYLVKTKYKSFNKFII